MEDTMEGLQGEEEEEDAQAEIDKILLEITAGALGAAPDALKDTLPAAAAATVPAAAVEDEEADDDLEEMKSRLEALRSQTQAGLWLYVARNKDAITVYFLDYFHQRRKEFMYAKYKSYVTHILPLRYKNFKLIFIIFSKL